MSGPAPTSSSPLLGGLRAIPRSSLLWRSGAILATIGLISGAFGAHALRRRMGITNDNIHAWETASHYATLNGLALLIVSLHPRFAAHRFAGPAIAVGSTVFSGSIMTLVLGGDKLKWMGPVTPMGGLAMIAGYIALAL